jgi:hypothetical protein
MNLRQNIIVQNAAGLLVYDLAFDKMLPLESQQAAGHFGAGLSVHQSLAAGPRNLNLFLGIEAPIPLFTQEQDAD